MTTRRKLFQLKCPIYASEEKNQISEVLWNNLGKDATEVYVFKSKF